ncbi:Tudor domain [Macleaya cordata]|uniref:Tudor domain n=1 Tax=Macleaya cordata TaxID=56857 RepID=A0A200QHH0_MACCD|nr:Tudor domain [Macleaya cordata]
METTCKELELGASSTSVYEIPGEPAIVINGMPNVVPSESSVPYFDTASDGELKRNVGFGEWLEGREVRKLFGEQFYSGTVTKYDRETGWYRVVYEDGDSEDLEWNELEEILLPLDIAIPLNALALKILKKSERSTHKKADTASTSRKSGGVGSKRKTMEGLHEITVTELQNEGQTNTNFWPGSTNQIELKESTLKHDHCTVSKT